MSKSDPQYVRLCKRLTRGLVADVTGGSGWSLAGYDVKPFPEEEEGADYVRRLLSQGILESASTAEYELVQEESGKVADTLPEYERQDHQEHQVQDAQRAAIARVKAQREEIDPDEDEYEADEARRRAVIEDQKDLGLDSDDPEEQMRPKQRKSASKGKKGQPASAE